MMSNRGKADNENVALTAKKNALMIEMNGPMTKNLTLTKNLG